MARATVRSRMVATGDRIGFKRARGLVPERPPEDDVDRTPRGCARR